MLIAKCLCRSNDKLGESPLWIDEEESIYWVDIENCLINKYDLRISSKKTWKFNEQIGSLAEYKKNIFVAATSNGFNFIDLKKNEIIPIIDPEIKLSNNRFNDGKCDSKGRFYAGSMNKTGENLSGSFYILYNNLSFKKIDENYITTNGPAFSPDNKYIYLTDTKKGIIYIATMDEDGLLNNKKEFININVSDGRPDGMAVDKNGNLWVALFGGSKVNCYDNQGKKVDEVVLPVSCVTSCAFGGKKFNTLFITTSSHKLSNEDKLKQPLAGSLFSIDLKISGIKVNKFKYESI